MPLAARADASFDSRLRTFVDQLPVVVWQAEPDGRVSFFNAAWYRYTGMADAESLGWGWRSAVPPDDLERAPWKSLILAHSARPYRIEVRIRHSGGALRWFEIDGTPEHDGRGRVVRWVGTCTDIDDRVRGAEALREAAGRSAFLARADEIIARVFDPNLILQAVADAAIESFADYCLFDVVDDNGVGLRRAALAHRDRDLAATFAVTRGAAPPLHHPTHPISVAWASRATVYRREIASDSYAESAVDAAHLSRMRRAGLRSLISAVVDARGKTFGVLTFCRQSGSPVFEDEDRRVAEDLARRVAVALENATLYGEARRVAEVQSAIARRESLYSRLGEALSSSLDLVQTVAAIVRVLVPAIASCAVVNLLDDREQLYMAAAHHDDPERDERLQALVGNAYLPADEALGSPLVVRTGVPVVLTSADLLAPDAASETYRGLARQAGLASALIVPIVYNGRVKGTLLVLRSDDAVAPFDTSDIPAFVEIAGRISPAIGNAEAYARERHVAQSFQTAALRIALPSVTGFRFEAIYEAGRSEALVGGDWYDVFTVGDGRLVVSIGDVVGSGLDAAIAMVNVRQTIRGVAQVHPDPGLMLQAADRTVRTQYPDRFVTAFAAVLDPITKQAAYANAGHLPALLRAPDRSVVALDSHTMPLGLINDTRVDVTNFSIEAGCALLLYTDGLVEADRDLIGGLTRLRQAFSQATDAPGAVRNIYDRVLERQSSDDVAMLLVRSDAAGDLRRWRFDPFWRDAVVTVRSQIVEAVLAAGIAAGREIDVELIFAEILSNLLRYADGTVDVYVERNDDNVVLHVLDKGPGLQFNPRLPADPLSESGRGLYLIAALADQFAVERRPGGGSHSRIVFELDVEGKKT